MERKTPQQVHESQAHSPNNSIMADTEYPLFCPNQRCPCHWKEHIRQLEKIRYRWSIKNGSYRSRLKGKIQRYRCKTCGKEFSSQYFHTDYYNKRNVDLEILERELSSCTSLRAISRKLRLSRGSISLGYMKLARQYMASETQIFQEHTLKSKAVVIDGFESFVRSKYEPNNINIGITGDGGRYIIGVNYAHLNRKGRMRAAQKQRAARMKEEYPLPVGHLKQKIELLLGAMEQRMAEKGKAVELRSDEKLEYVEAVKKRGMRHTRISSHEARTGRNPLFPVNQVDKMFRKDLVEHVRKTQCWGKDANHQMERMEIYRGYYNYRKKYLENDVKAREWYRHSDAAGIPRGVVEKALEGVYRVRQNLSHVYDQLSFDQRQLWFRMLGRPGRTKRRYIPAYMTEHVSKSECGVLVS